MRMFTAVRLSEEAVEDLEDFLESRREAFDVRWTPPEHWHVTLAFMAEVPLRNVDRLIEHTEAAVARRRPMPLAIRGGGVFPDPFAAKVWWAGVEIAQDDRGEFDRLAAGCRTAAATSGIEVDGARFRPHLTLGRPRRPANASRWLALLETYRGPAWDLCEVELITSELGQGRNGSPRHTLTATFPVR